MSNTETDLVFQPSPKTDRSMLIQYGIIALGTNLLVPPLLKWPVIDNALSQVCAGGGGAVVLLGFVAKIQLRAWQLWAQVLLGLGIASIDLIVGSHSMWYEEGLPIVVGLSIAFLAGAQADYLSRTSEFMKIRGSAVLLYDCWTAPARACVALHCNARGSRQSHGANQRTMLTEAGLWRRSSLSIQVRDRPVRKAAVIPEQNIVAFERVNSGHNLPAVV